MKQNENINTSHTWRRIISNQIYALNSMWLFSKVYVFLRIIDVLITTLFSPLVVLVTATIFDGLGQGENFIFFANQVLILGSVYLVYIVWGHVFGEIIKPIYNLKFHEHIQCTLFEKTKKIELSQYDNPEFLNNFIINMRNADTYITSALDNITMLLSFFGTLVALTGILGYIDMGAMILICISAIISLFCSSKLKRIDYDKTNNITPVSRMDSYIDRVYKLVDFSKELRLTKVSDIILEKFDENTIEYNTLIKMYGRKQWTYKILESINNNCLSIGIIGLTLYKVVVLSSVTLGGFSVVIDANMKFRSALVQIASLVSSLPKQSLMIDKYREYIEYMPDYGTGKKTADDFRRLELRNVSFGYEESAIVLNNINFHINKGEHVVLVGDNGAGKTTLIKLIVGLYTPHCGEIRYNECELCEYDIDSYRKRIGAVFQDFCIFAATVGENVATTIYDEEYEPRIMEALSVSGFGAKLQELQYGLETHLTREFFDDGVNLSVGENQKIAIARALVNGIDLFVLDEPSSALDPIAEHTLNEQIKKFAKGRTIIQISHRLSMAKNADRIYVMEQGRIVEEGTHKDLIETNGKYAEMFRAQAEKYETGVKLRE